MPAPTEPDAEPGSTAELPALAPHPPAAASAQTLSVLGLVFGIVGLLASFAAVGLVFALVGVILSHLGLRREPTGRSMAIAGLACGYAGLGISVIWGVILLASVLVPLFAVGLFASLSTIGG
ncbi:MULTISPECIES: DUF4190 domain-containing protein [unclassified Microcella]|uniref:DUF4190 domain-containing protein n=1 Tax=unclassified Microcella TaxID=2630066 RepID=UPI0006F8A3B1|nr:MULTISPECIES: DUF4190 domain-containing protein [unclassified Microcella]KQV26154.1 hypothetical protein ASC54_04285 [Yonghaparkia sp. Root332]KRF33044.1 hypothetical protein ASG83_03370 [Yonghaparkia sp. Soil809]